VPIKYINAQIRSNVQHRPTSYITVLGGRGQRSEQLYLPVTAVFLETGTGIVGDRGDADGWDVGGGIKSSRTSPCGLGFKEINWADAV